MAGNTHTGRNRRTATNTTIQVPQMRAAPSESPEVASMIERTCNPISRKTEFSSKNWTVAQLLRWLNRDAPPGMAGVLVPITRPATTTAYTPDALISSAGI